MKSKKLLTIATLGSLLAGAFVPLPYVAHATTGVPSVEIDGDWGGTERTLLNGRLITADIRINSNLAAGDDIIHHSSNERAFTFNIMHADLSALPAGCDVTKSTFTPKSFTCVYRGNQKGGDALVFPVSARLSGDEGDVVFATATALSSSNNGASNQIHHLRPISIRTAGSLDLVLGSGRYTSYLPDDGLGYLRSALQIQLPQGAKTVDPSKPITFDMVLAPTGNMSKVFADPAWFSHLTWDSGSKWSNDTRMLAAPKLDRSLDPDVTVQLDRANPRILHFTISNYEKMMEAWTHVDRFNSGVDAVGTRAIAGGTFAMHINKDVLQRHSGNNVTGMGSGTVGITLRNLSYTDSSGRVISGASADTVKDNNDNNVPYTVSGGYTANLFSGLGSQGIKDGRELAISQGRTQGLIPDRPYHEVAASSSGSAGWSNGVLAFPGQYVYWGGTSFNTSKAGSLNRARCVLVPSGQGAWLTGNWGADARIDSSKVQVAYSTDRGNLLGKTCNQVNWTTSKPSDPKTITGMRFENIVHTGVNNTRAGITAEIGTDPNLAGGRTIMVSASYQWHMNRNNPKDYVAGNHPLTTWDKANVQNPVYTTLYNGTRIAGFGQDTMAFTTASVRVRNQISVSTPSKAETEFGAEKPADTAFDNDSEITLNGRATVLSSNTPVGSTGGQIVVTLPPNTTYVAGSSDLGEPTISTSGDSQVLTWNGVNSSVGVVTKYHLKVRAYGAGIRDVKSEFSIPSKIATDKHAATSADTTQFSIVAPGETAISKNAKLAITTLIDNQGKNSWLIKYRNLDARSQDVMDIIDILPFNGDDRIRPGGASNFHGSHLVENIITPPGTEVYVTTASRDTLVADPSAPANGGMGTPSSIWTRYSRSATPKDYTGIRFINRNVGAGVSLNHEIKFQLTGSYANEKLVNSVTARATTTGLKTVETAVNLTRYPQGLTPPPPRVSKTLTNPNGVRLAPGETVEWLLSVDIPQGSPGAPNYTLVDQLGNGYEDLELFEPSQGKIKGNKLELGPTYAGDRVTVKARARLTNNFQPPLVNHIYIEGMECLPGETKPTCDTHTFNPNTNIRVDKTRVTQGTSTPDNSTIIPGDVVHYKITAKADAGQDAQIAPNVVVRDLGDTANGSLDNITFYSPSKGTIQGNVWNVGDLAPGETVTAWVQGTVNAKALQAGKVVNRTTIENPHQPTPGTPVEPGKPDSDYRCEVNTGDVTTDGDRCDEVENPVLSPGAPLINKETLTDPAKVGLAPGQQIQYRVTVGAEENTAGATDVVMRELGGEFLENIVLSTPSQGTIQGTTWNVGTVLPNTPATVTVTATIKSNWTGTPLTNTAVVSNPDHPEPTNPSQNCQVNPDLNSDTDRCDQETLAYNSALKIDKVRVDDSDSPIASNVVPGETIRYKVSVRNPGQHAEASVTVKDLGGQHLENVTVVSATKGTFQADTWNVGTLLPNETVIAYVTARVKSPLASSVTSLPNDAIVFSPLHPRDETPGVPNNTIDEDNDQWDRHEDPVLPPAKPLINKEITSDKTTLFAGTQITYLVEVKAKADSYPETNVVVTDLGGPFLTDVKITKPSKGTIQPDGKWFIGDMNPGEVQTATVTAKIAEGSGFMRVINTVIVGSDHFPPPTPSNDVPPNPADDTTCVMNDTVDTDTDGCDRVPINIGTPPLTINLPLTGEISIFYPLAALSVLLLGGVVTYFTRRKKN